MERITVINRMGQFEQDQELILRAESKLARIAADLENNLDYYFEFVVTGKLEIV